MTNKLRNNAPIIIRIVGKAGFIYPLIVKFLFERVYISKYHYYWDYLGAKYSPNFEKATVSWIVAVVFTIALLICFESKTSTLFGILVNISIMPSLSIYWLKNQSKEALFLIVVYWVIWWAMTIIVTALNNHRLEDAITGADKEKECIFIPDRNNFIVWIVYSLTLATTIILSAKYGGLRLFINLDDVYTYRLSGVSMSSLENYIFAWNTNAFLPLLFGIHYLQRRKLLFISDIILMLLCYGIFGNKSMLMTIPLVFGIIILDALHSLKYLSSLIGAFVILYIALSFVVPSQMFIALGDRILDGPAAAHFNYYDFFSNTGNPLLYLRESIFRFVADSPYEQTVTKIIGSSSKYYSGVYNNVNNGLFSTAYANFGMAGVVLQPILIVFTASVFFNLIRSYNDTIQSLLLVIHALFLISTSYFSWLMTGGLIIEAVVMVAIQRFDCLRVISFRPQADIE